MRETVMFSGQAHNAHVGYGLFVLRRGGASSSSIFVLGNGQIHKLDRVDHGGLRVDVVWGVVGIGIQIVFEVVQAREHLDRQLANLGRHARGEAAKTNHRRRGTRVC